MKIELTDAQWARIASPIPKPKAKPKGGRPRMALIPKSGTFVL
jgi:hypothetical protein